MKKMLIAALLPLMALAAYAQQTDTSTATTVTTTQESAEPEKPKFKIAPTGRLLIDAGVFISPTKELFKDGATLADIRAGVTMNYGKWMAMVSMGYHRAQLTVMDVYMQYTFNPQNRIRAGYLIHQFGMQSATSTSMKPTMFEPTSAEVFAPKYQLGAMYIHSRPHYYGTLSIFVEPDAIKKSATDMNGTGYGMMSRQVWRPIARDGAVVQVGISGAYFSPQNNGADKPHDFFKLSANFPSRVVNLPVVSATLDKCVNQWRFTPEVLLVYNRFAFGSQYYFAQVNRKDGLQAYRAQGAYVALRGLILGKQLDYNASLAYIETPKPGSLECVLAYNYTTLSDAKAGIFGGRYNDVSCTLTYYINKYFLARLHYNYSHRWDSATLPRTDFSGFQLRVQAIF